MRISASLCFIGHGAFGLMTKPEWLTYFAVAHIPESIAFKLMPLIGLMDITMGLITLISPRRGALIFMTFWAVWTALLRPLAGVPTEAGWLEFLERAGNYGVPFAFLILSGMPENLQMLYRKIREPRINWGVMQTLTVILRWTTGLLLIGHGGFGALKQKTMLIGHWQSIGLPGDWIDPLHFIIFIGLLEIVLGLWVILRPARPLLIFIVIWKIFTELLYPISGTPIWEFIERFGSYGGPLALFWIYHKGYRLIKKDTL